MKSSLILVWIILLLLSVSPFHAVAQDNQDDTCLAFVEAALQATDEVCDATGRNQACYGHLHLEAQPQAPDIPFKFNQVGDRVNITNLGTLRLSPMDMQNDSWGVALMRLQADISANRPGSNVTLLIFGDVQIENAVPVPVTATVIVRGPANANLRRQPSNRAFVLGSLPPLARVQARGRSEDGTWIYASAPAAGGNGWLRRSLVDAEAGFDLDNLKVINPSLVSYGPMQAFFLRNGTNQTSCQDTPNDGVLIQTPEGVAEVRLWINEVKIRLGSTAFIQASPDNSQMVVNTLEGKAEVEALGVQQVAVAGTSVTVQLNDNQQPIAPPSAPEPYESAAVEALPVQNLERPIEIAPPVEIIPSPTPTQTATSTPLPPIPTATETATAMPSNTPVPTATRVRRTPTATATPLPPTATETPIPPTATATSLPPTATLTPTLTSTP